MNTFRDFDKDDWYGFAGAERFDDGSEPLMIVNEIADTVGGLWGITIDANGIQVDYIRDSGGEFEAKTYTLERGSLSKQSMTLLASRIDPLTMNLEELGFERIC
jgi:hypothetical protein